MVKKEDRSEFVGSVIDIFEGFLDEKGIVIPNTEKEDEADLAPDDLANFYGSDYDRVEKELEELFVNWKVLEDERPLVDYCFKVSLNGGYCKGIISVKAADPDDAYQRAQDKISDGLSKAFPELDIEYDVEPLEDDGYPIYRVISSRNEFDYTEDIFNTAEEEKAKKIFQEKILINAVVCLEVKTSALAEWSVLRKYIKK